MEITYKLTGNILTRTDSNKITYNMDEEIICNITYDDSWELPLKAKINYDIYEEIIDIEDDKFVLPKKIASVFGFNLTIFDETHESITLVESIGNPPKSKLYSEDDIIDIVSNNPLDNLEVDGKLTINSTSSLVIKDGSTFAADIPYIEITVDDLENISGTLTEEQLEIIKKDNAYIKINFRSENEFIIATKVSESIMSVDTNKGRIYDFYAVLGTNILFFEVDEHGTYIGIQVDISTDDFIEGVKVNGNILTLDDGKKAVLNLKSINNESIVGEGNIEITIPVTDVQVGGKSVLDGTVAKVDLSSYEKKSSYISLTAPEGTLTDEQLDTLKADHSVYIDINGSKFYFAADNSDNSSTLLFYSMYTPVVIDMSILSNTDGSAIIMSISSLTIIDKTYKTKSSTYIANTGSGGYQTTNTTVKKSDHIFPDLSFGIPIFQDSLTVNNETYIWFATNGSDLQYWSTLTMINNKPVIKVISMKDNGDTYTLSTPYVFNLAQTSDIPAVKNPEIVTLTATAEATQGTITAAQLTTLQAYDFNIIEFNNEVYTLMDKGHSEGYLTYSHVGIENSTIFIKTITITISTLAWVLNTRIVPEMEYDESTKTLNIVG